MMLEKNKINQMMSYLGMKNWILYHFQENVWNYR